MIQNREEYFHIGILHNFQQLRRISLKAVLVSAHPPLQTHAINPPSTCVNIAYRKVTSTSEKQYKVTTQRVSKSHSFDEAPRYVETDDSYALCCLFLRTEVEISSCWINSTSTADAKINKHSLMNGKIQIQWQSAKSNQEGNSFSCIYLQALCWWDFFFFFFHRITSNSFCPIFCSGAGRILA